MSVIRQKDKGVVATLGSYGRGVDIRFAVDSLVIIGFIPDRLDNVRQMAGRSSRTLGVHSSRLIAQHTFLTSQSVQSHLTAMNEYNMEDGMRIAKIMRGRRRSNVTDDSVIMPFFAKGWRFKADKLVKKLTISETFKYEKIG